jgi:hypothetical protein
MYIEDFVNKRRLRYAGREQANCPHSGLSAFHRQRAAERFHCRPSWHHATHKRGAYPTRVWRMHDDHSVPLLNHTTCRRFGGDEVSSGIGGDRQREALHRKFSERNALLRNTDGIERNIDGGGGAIGGAVARGFAREGAKVFLASRTLARDGSESARLGFSPSFYNLKERINE